MKQVLAAIALTAALSGCNSPPAEPAKPDVSGESAQLPPEETGPPTTELPGNGARSVSEQTDDYLFEYAYPSEAGRIDALATLLDSRLEERRTALARGSAEARQQAREDGFPYNKHSFSGAWEVVANLPGWLSLSHGFSAYEGGAHGNHGFTSLVWNKETSEAIEAEDLFTSAKALDDALGERFCAALNAERAKRRGKPVAEESDDQFDRCVAIKETTVLAGSSNGRTFNRVGIQIGPYVAGPYAEGSFEFTFPVDAAVLEAVKPEYRTSFSTRN